MAKEDKMGDYDFAKGYKMGDYDFDYVFSRGKFKGRKFKNIIKTTTKKELNSVVNTAFKNALMYEIEDLFQLKVMQFNFKDLKTKNRIKK